MFFYENCISHDLVVFASIEKGLVVNQYIVVLIDLKVITCLDQNIFTRIGVSSANSKVSTK